MKYTSLFVGFLLMFSLKAWALSPQNEISMQSKTTSDARLAAANRAKAAQLEAAITSYYYSGLASAEAGDLERGRFLLEQYVRLAGAGGKFSGNAMYQIDRINAYLIQRDAARVAAAAAERAAAERAAAEREAADKAAADSEAAQRAAAYRGAADRKAASNAALRESKDEAAVKAAEPDVVYFYAGKSLADGGNLGLALLNLKQYLNMTGTAGIFHEEALAEIVKVELAIEKRDADEKAAADAGLKK